MIHLVTDLSHFFQLLAKYLKSTSIHYFWIVLLKIFQFQIFSRTVTVLLSTTQEWLTLLDQRKNVHCILFDVQKAFDTVPHKQLLSRLKDLQIDPTLLTWFHSYLCNRKQRVVLNGVTSESVNVISGVPQGSI